MYMSFYISQEKSNSQLSLKSAAILYRHGSSSCAITITISTMKNSYINILHYLDTLVRDEQIVGTQDKSQRIVAQRLLSHLQYLDATKSSAKDLSLSSVILWLVGDNIYKLITNM